MKRICNDLCVTTNPGNIIYQQISGQDRTGQDVAVQVPKLMHREKLMREHTSRGSSRGMQLGLAAEIAQSYFWFWLGLAGCF